ncbi:HotDog domain-containing protein [Pyrenochaeta sp. MPI-SDFR-AT-0127]|nr:HotDog domain-containing protein [Pyrenochaeta sp. MPI-SDFR-AT-0127]
MDYYKTIPWCNNLLQRPDVIPYTPTCRLEPDASGHLPTLDQFFHKNLRNTELIPNYIRFYQNPFSNHQSEEQEDKSPCLLIPSSTLLLDLHPRVNGFNGSAHGGLISTLIDEAIGSLIFVNDVIYKQVQRQGRSLPSNVLNMYGVAMFTASMNVRFRRPLEMSQVVVATATFNRIEGRKVFLNADVRSGDGLVFATCEGMWMSVPKEKL